MRSRSLAVALVLALASAGSSAAQAGSLAAPDSSSVTPRRAARTDTLPTIRIPAGTLVRIQRTDPRRPWVRGIVAAADSAGITVRADGDMRIVRVARAEIVRFDVAGARRSGLVRAARGARDGLIVGAVLSAAAIGGVCVQHGCGDEGLGFAVVFLGAPITGATTVLGVLTGAAGSGRRWMPVPIPTGIGDTAMPVVEPDPGPSLPRRGPPRQPRQAPGLRKPPGAPFGVLPAQEEDGLTPLLAMRLLRHPRGGSLRLPEASVPSGMVGTGPIVAPDTSVSPSCSSPGGSC